MNEYVVIEDAPILIPNKEHSNFTEGNRKIPKGSVINAKELNIKGKRRGEDFVYKLLKTKDNNLIHFKKTKPMNVTEVTLGASGERRYSNPSSPSPTVVNMPPTSKLFTTATIVGGLIGGVAGMIYANKKGFTSSKKTLYITGGAIAGFFISRYMERNKIIVKPSK